MFGADAFPGVGAATAAGPVLDGLPGPGGIPVSVWMQAGSAVLGKALGPSSAGPSRADSSAYVSTPFDSSNWSVATGGDGRATSAAGLPSWVIAAGMVGALVAGVVWIKKAYR